VISLELRKIIEEVVRRGEAYIPRKVSSKSKHRFGFVRFEDKECAIDEAIKSFNLRTIKCKKITIHWKNITSL